MSQKMTKAAVRAFQARWAAVNAAERAELRATPAGMKLRQLAALAASVDQLGWAERLRAQEADVRDRWNRLRKALNG